MLVLADALVPVREAAKLLGISYQAVIHAIKDGRLSAFCGVCGHQFSLQALNKEPGHEHRCLKGPADDPRGYRAVVRRAHLAKYTVNPIRRAAGLARRRPPGGDRRA